MASRTQKEKQRANQINLSSSQLEVLKNELLAESEAKARLTTLEQLKQFEIRQESYFSGPFPRPDHAEQYEKICPGFMDRSLQLAEKEQANLNESNKRRDWQYLFFRCFQVCCGLVLALFIVGGAIYLVSNEYGIGWYSGMLFALATLILAAVYGQKSNQDEPQGSNSD